MEVSIYLRGIVLTRLTVSSFPSNRIVFAADAPPDAPSFLSPPPEARRDLVRLERDADICGTWIRMYALHVCIAV